MQGAKFCASVDKPVSLSMSERLRNGIQSEHLFAPVYDVTEHKLRKFIFAKYFEHNDEQETSLRALITARDQLAKLTGFETFAHRAQRHMVLSSYENVRDFLEQARQKLVPLLDPEIEQVERIVNRYSSDFASKIDRVCEPDFVFAVGMCQHELLNQLGRISEFFHLETLINGYELILNKMYGLSLRMLLPDKGEIWLGNVLKLNVHAEDETFQGSIFLDIDNRQSKTASDCHFTVRCSKLLENDVYQTPIVVLSFSIVSANLQNQTITSSNPFESICLNPQQAENFFHEMGHAIHSILGRTRYQHVAGTRCPTDFAEVPSHLMECYFNDPKILSTICKDKSGRTLPLDQAELLVKSRRMFGAFHTLQQVLYSTMDVEMHGNYALPISRGELTTTDLFNQLGNKILPGIERVDRYAYHQRMSHMVTYGAKYYSYLVARASASMIYKDLFESDPFSRENGLRWAKVQSYGGELPSSHLLQIILGRTPSTNDLASLLFKEANSHQPSVSQL